MMKEMMMMLEIIEIIEGINREMHSLYAWQWGQHQALERTKGNMIRELFTMAMATGYKVKKKGESFILIAPMR